MDQDDHCSTGEQPGQERKPVLYVDHNVDVAKTTGCQTEHAAQVDAELGSPAHITDVVAHLVGRCRRVGCGEDRHLRSEEHTSELQSLMRISYAVFCLKKKTTKRKHKHLKSTTNNT